MRRALKEPVWLFAAFSTAEPVRLHRAMDEALDGILWLVGDGHALLLAPFASGALARKAWASFVASEVWRGVADACQTQPLLHLLPRTGVWESEPRGAYFGEFTVDGTIQTRADRSAGERPKMRLPEVDALPSGPGIQTWPVLGHPGRILVCATDEPSLVKAGHEWAPAGFPSSEVESGEGRALVEAPWTWSVA